MANNSGSSGLPPYYDRSNSNSSKPHPSSGSPGAAAVGNEASCMNLVGKTIPIDGQRCFVKGEITCGDKELYALESDKPKTGYGRQCPQCNRVHVYFDKPDRGYYAFATDIHGQINKEKFASERAKGPKEIGQLPFKRTDLPPLDRPVLGENKGIEGDSNSCYMDSTMFCMFAYSKVFDSLLHMDVGKKQSVQQLQILLRENIVNVLRSDTGFVERDALFHLRALLSEATKDPSFKEMEKDPSEFLRALEDLFRYSPLKTISPDQPPNENQSNVTTNIMWEMFDANPHKKPSTSIASIFRNSLAEIPARLATIPPFLILVAPRHARSQRSYRYITPDRQITLDQNILQLVCLECRQTNHNADSSRDFYFCKECCLNEPTATPSDITVKCYCHGCLEKLHKRVSREKLIEHQPKQMKTTTYKLNLFAVLCIEVCHYVAFVKCHKRDGQEEWLFFDSMSDRIHNEKNVPCVSPVRDFNRWIDGAENDKYFFEDIDRRRNGGKPISQAFNEDQLRQLRLFRDGAFFFYENAEASYQ